MYCFLGLTISESGKLSNYFHFREPIHLEKKSLTYRAALDKSLHFLDSIDEDIPKGKRKKIFLINLLPNFSTKIESFKKIVIFHVLEHFPHAIFHGSS